MDIKDMLYDGETVYCSGECIYGRDMTKANVGIFASLAGMMSGMLNCRYAVTDKRFIIGIMGAPATIQFSDIKEINTVTSAETGEKDVALLVSNRGSKRIGEVQEMYLRSITDPDKLVSSLRSMVYGTGR